MKVLVLGVVPSPLSPILEKYGCSVVEHCDPVDVRFLRDAEVEFAISFRYRHIIKEPVIEYLQGRVINLHISFLPWNRGADPNLWSFLKDTPKGVSIHYVDEGLDTGDIIAQKEMEFDISKETLATTYEKLNREIIELFRQEWTNIAAGKAAKEKQPAGGSYHKLKDKERFKQLLAKKGWETPVKELIGKALTTTEERE